MKIRRIDIIDDILGNEVALHRIGQISYDYLIKEISKCKDSTLFVIDLSEANPIDYKFCEIAFGEIYKNSIKNKKLDFVFKSDKFQLRELITGILDYYKISRNYNTKEIDVFKENNLYLKNIFPNKNNLEFISNLSEDHYEVLRFINKKITVTSIEIQNSITETPDITMPILNKLVEAKFILREEESIYSSIENLIYNGE